MSLPPSFLDELRARTPLAGLIGRKTRLAKAGRQWKGCCPFHGEKSPSFYVYDDHYHCFGCGAHGDAIAFVMQSDGASFPEAVERLAGEAGLEVPKATPQQAKREAKARDLHAVLEAANEAYQRRLRLPEGRAGLDYLLRRGLSEQTIQEFGLGWSGGGRGTLAADLKPLGIEPRQLVEAGLMRAGEEGAPPVDLFFNRVMFPIRDRRGRLVSFGGRILGDGQPKYVNGPETDLFSKRRNLYGIERAREAAFRGKPVLVAEGYMDVIALHQAGFTGAVAPLGTALTEEQLAELWRMVPQPVLCFDGDAAGSRAATRAAELALPMLSTEQGLRFVTLPKGQDPDDLIKRGGPGAFQQVLDQAKPLAEVLYGMVAERHPGATPEARAALRRELEEAAQRIPDKFLAGEYRKTLLDRFFATGRTRPAQAWNGGARPAARGQGRFGGPPPAPMNGPAPPPDPAIARMEQLRCLLAITLAHPQILDELEEALAGLDLPEGPGRQLRDGVLAWYASAHLAGEPLDATALADHLQATCPVALGWARQYALGALPAARPEALPKQVLDSWWYYFGRFRGEEALLLECRAAEAEFNANPTEASQTRFMRLLELLAAQRSGDLGDEAAGEAG